MRAESDGWTHIVIPDTQAKPDVPVAHLQWIGRYIVEEWAGRPRVRVVHLGDHWDMPSLSSYDKGKARMEGQRIVADLEAGNDAFDFLNEPLDVYNARRRSLKERVWNPDRHFVDGNHEDRVTRATENDAQLRGLLRLDMMNVEAHGWQRHPFLTPVVLDGVAYAHYFYNPMTGRPFSGTVENRLRQVGHTFTMGHQQQLLYGLRYVLGRAQHGLVAGACYLHEEDYKGPQGNAHWRGIVVCHEVRDGTYDPMFVSLDYLCRRFEGVSLAAFLAQ